MMKKKDLEKNTAWKNPSAFPLGKIHSFSALVAVGGKLIPPPTPHVVW